FVSCTGSITDTLAGAPTQNTHLNRTGVASACGTIKPCPGESSQSLVHFKAYTFLNPNTTNVCVTINVSTTACGRALHSSAYAGSYDPTNLCLNYLGDPGNSSTSMTYSVQVPALTNLIIVVNETAPNACTESYVITVQGIGSNCPTITPTP